MGYEFRGYGGQIRVSGKKLDAFKRRVSEIFRRNRGRSVKSRYAEYRSYAIGWLGYFALDQVKSPFTHLDKWVRRRVRACYWKQWRKSKTRLKKLISLSVSYRVARGFAIEVARALGVLPRRPGFSELYPTSTWPARVY